MAEPRFRVRGGRPTNVTRISDRLAMALDLLGGLRVTGDALVTLNMAYECVSQAHAIVTKKGEAAHDFSEI